MLPKLEHEWDHNLGDMVLGMPVIEEACRCDGVRLVDRLPVLITHGLCHLVGHRHSNKDQWEKVSINLIVHAFIKGLILELGSHSIVLTMHSLPHSVQMHQAELKLLTSFNLSFGTKLRPLTFVDHTNYSM